MKEEIEKIVAWMQEFVSAAGKNGVTLGLSGGVDSAVVAAIAVRAFGPDNVNAIALPIESDPKDLEDAARIADQLEIGPLTVYDLNATFQVMALSLDMRMGARRADIIGQPEDRIRSLCLGNMKARLRMIAVYNEAAMCNHLVVGTGNKSELMVGYITKWGDGACDFEPLGEYFKTEVVEMARELGLPEDICTREPSPGLEPGVTDRSELGGGYDEIDPILKYIDGGSRWPENSRKIDEYNKGIGFSKEEYQRVIDLYAKASHKKHMPPSYPRYGR